MHHFRAPAQRRHHSARPNALRRLVAALSVGLLGIVGLVSVPTAAVAAVNSDIVVGQVTMEPSDAQLTVGDRVVVSGSWSAVDAAPQKGDSFFIGLPPEFEFPQAVPFQLLGPDSVVWGNCLTDPATGLATCVLTAAVTEKPELVHGTWEFEVEAVKATTATEVEFDLNGDTVSVPLPGEGGIDDGIELPGEMSKSGVMNGDNWSMTWTIDLPGANMAGQQTVNLTDTLGEGHVLCDPVGLTVQTVRGGTVIDVTDIATLDGAAGDPGFSLTLTAPKGGFDPNVTYRVSYQTCTPDGKIDPEGTTYANSAQVEGWGEAGVGVGTVTNQRWHGDLTKSGSVLGGKERNGTIAWTVTIPGDQLFGKNDFTVTEALGAGHELCTDTLSGMRVFERYGPSSQKDREITHLLSRSATNTSAQGFSMRFIINSSAVEFKKSDYRYIVTYETCVTSTALPEGGTEYTNSVDVDGESTTGTAEVPPRAQGKSGSINTGFVTVDGVEHMPQTTLDWNVTIPGEKIDGLTELALQDTLSASQTVCEAGDPSGGLAERLNLKVRAIDQIDGGGLAAHDLTGVTSVSLTGQTIDYTVAAPELPTPTGTIDTFSREYQYTFSYTTCTTSGGMDAPGTEYSNLLSGSGISFDSSVTQNNRGSGTGTGVTRGSVAVTKSLAGTPGAAFIPADTTFAVHVKEVDPQGVVQDEYDLNVPLGGDPVSGFSARGKGWTVELSEPTFPRVPGVTWGAPAFQASEGVTVSADGTVATAALTPGSNIAVSLQNTALLGSASVSKVLEGPDAALDLVDADKTYQVTAEVDTSALGKEFPAQPNRTFGIRAGETVALDNLPIGAKLTLSEARPADDDLLTWSAPVISPNPITIDAEHATAPAAVTITNHAERTLGTFEIVKSVTGAQADNRAVPDSVTVTATWTQDGVAGGKTLTVPTDGTPVAFGENLLIGTEVTLTETPLVDGSSIAWGAPVWSGTGVTVDGESAVVSITRDAEAQVLLENHAATSEAGISLIKGIAGEAAGEVADTTEFPVTATWTDAEGETQSKRLGINAVAPTSLGVDLPAGTVVTITEGKRPAFDTVVWGSITIGGPGVTDTGDGSAEIIVSDQQGDDSLVTVVNEATWAPGTFTLSKAVTGILLDNPDVPETVTVTATWLDGDEVTSSEVALPTDGTAVPFGQDLPHGTIVTLSELPVVDGAAFTWNTPAWSGDDIMAHEDGTAELTVGAATDAEVTVTNSVTAKLGSLVVTKSLTGDGAGLVEDIAFPVTATWTDLRGEAQQAEIEVRAGEPTTIDNLPMGTEVILTENAADTPVNARWHGATWSSDDETVVVGETDGNTVMIVVTGESGARGGIDVSNEFEKLPDLAVTGGALIKTSVVVLAALLIGVGILMIVLHRRRQA